MIRKLSRSLKLLRKTLRAAKASPQDEVIFAAASKAFEVAFEYAWKALKREADQAGYETYNPRDAVKTAQQLAAILHENAILRPASTWMYLQIPSFARNLRFDVSLLECA